MKITFENYFLPIDIALRMEVIVCNCEKYSLVEFETREKRTVSRVIFSLLRILIYFHY